MMAKQAQAARRHLDKRFAHIRQSGWLMAPQRGWIRAIRDALGMSAAQLAKRLGVSQPTVTAMEQGEVERSITLATLDRAAQALGCRVVYALIPENKLEAVVRERAIKIARNRLMHVGHTMLLEDQAVKDSERAQLRSATEHVLRENPRNLWSEE
jgi:predicted DNA-binding mobile mystery protein A